ncbi:retrovirus-related pol polyprotein from transposon TNT 1-94 [Tanacetum coccineum]
MNMLNRNCKTSFAKPEFLKKAQRANPRLYDIGCYNDNFSLMLAPESDETIRLDEESRSKLSDLIRPFDYDQLNNLYDLFVPQCEKSPEQHYLSTTLKMSHTYANKEISKESFRKQTTLLEKRIDESIPWDQECKSSKELFKIKKVLTRSLMEWNVANKRSLKEHILEMVDDLRYFNSLEHEVDTLKYQLETQKTQFLNEIDRLSMEYYYADHMNAILGVYTDLDEVTNLQCDYLKTLVKCDRLEKELSKSRTMSKSFEALQKHAINLELDLQQYLKAQLQDKEIAISELKKLIEKMKGKSVETKFEKSSVIRQPNAFKSQRQSVLGKPAIFSDSLEKKDFSKSKSVTKNDVSNDFSKQVTAQILPQNIKSIIKNTNVIAPGIVSRPQLKSNRMGDRVMPNNSEGKKQQVEDHRRNFKFSNNKTFVTACNDSLNAKTSNVKFVCVTCGKCVLNDNHDLCVLHYINGVNSRTRQPIVVPISTRESKPNVNQSVATSHKKTITTDSTIKKPRNIIRKRHEQVSKTCGWWYPKFTPPRYKWKPKSPTGNVNPNVSMPLGNASRTANILEHMTPRNDQITPILGKGDLVQGTITIKRVYYVEGLNHNLFSVGQFCDADLEVSFRKSTCYIRDLKGNDLLTSSRSTDLYSITLQDTTTPNPICLIAKATSSQAWLWHRRLSYLNFDTINFLSKNNIVTGLPKLKFIKDHLCSSCELGKAKRKSFHTKTTPSLKRRLQLLHMDLCGPIWVESINEKKYVLVIIDDYSRYTWTHFLRSKDETPEVLIDFLALVQRGLHAQVRTVRIDKGMEFLNKTLHAYFAKEGYSTQSRAYRVFNKRTRMIVETIHVNFDELPQMASDHVSSDPVEIVTTSNELDLLFSPMFDELLNGTTLVMSKYFVVHAADAHTKPPTHEPIITATENIIQAETNNEYTQVDDDEFVNVFSTLVQERGETSSRHVDSSNMHTFYQHHPSAQRWTKDHPLEQVIGNPSQSVRTRRQLEIDGKMCMFTLTVSQTEPKNIKEAMANSAWIEAMQEELHQFDLLRV